MKNRIKSQFCTNCGQPLKNEDNFCPDCGQENDNKRQSFRKVFSDLIQGFLSIDSRLANSLPALLFRPGYLTKEYLNGRRQRYLDPVRMFITIVVIYFIMASFGEDKINVPKKNSIADVIENAEQQSADTAIFKEGPFKVIVDQKSDSTENNTDELELDDRHYKRIKELVKKGHTDTEVVLDSLNIKNTAWNRFYYGEVIKFAGADFTQFSDFLISKLPWFIFFLMPVFALLLKLIYMRRDFLYIDHLIFAFHLHSFLFMAGIFYLIIFNLTGTDLSKFASIAVLIYSILAFKNFYKQSWRKTIFKMIILWFLYGTAALFSFLISLVVIFLIY